jgi:hypothetical protein
MDKQTTKETKRLTRVDSFELMAKELLKRSKVDGNEERAKEILGNDSFLKMQILSTQTNKFQDSGKQ